MSELYPWPGEFKEGDPEAPVAVVTLAKKKDLSSENIAIWGPMKTENLGIEKVAANVISNPNIRFLIVCGDEIKGHRSGASLIALYKNGVDENGRIIDSPGAVPYIENLSKEAIERFRKQIEVIDMLGCTETEKIEEKARELADRNPEPMEEPYIAIRLKEEEFERFDTALALHAAIELSPWGEVSTLEVP